MRRATAGAWALAALCVLLWAPAARAQGSPAIARAAAVTAPAWLSNRTGAPALALTSGYILNPGDRIDTRGGGRVVIDLSDGSIVIVEPGSVVVLKDFRDASSLRELFEIAVGMVRVKINHFAGRPNPYRMNSPTASIAVRGTEFSIKVDQQGNTEVVVYEGSVEVTSLSDPSRRILIEAGRGALVGAGQDFHIFTAPGRDVGRNGNGPDAALPQESRADAFPHDEDQSAWRATASIYDQFVGGISNLAQLPFLFRFTAFPEAHLDSLENPAYATEFKTGEGRIFVLPTASVARGLSDYQETFGASGSSPGNYSLSPQFSMFTPIGQTHWYAGGGVSGTSLSNEGSVSRQDFDAAGQGGTDQISGKSTGGFLSGSLVAARQMGRNSFGVELERLTGSGTLSSATTEFDAPGQTSTERIASSSRISQTRLTAGFSRDFSKTAKLGVFYRYALLDARDSDSTHTVDGATAALNSTNTYGHSFEIGLRVRGEITPRLWYGVTGSWLGVSLQDALLRSDAVASHERDRYYRGSAAAGLGYAISRRVVATMDVAGGIAQSKATRVEDATSAVLQTADARRGFVSLHSAIQADVTRKLFASASLIDVWRSRQLGLVLRPDQFGHWARVTDSFFPQWQGGCGAGRNSSDFGVGWRFSRNLFAQYVLSTDYGRTPVTHTLMLRYTFRVGRE